MYYHYMQDTKGITILAEHQTHLTYEKILNNYLDMNQQETQRYPM